MASNQPAEPGDFAESTAPSSTFVKRCTSCPSNIEELDPEGDVILCVESAIKLRVSTKVLSVASPSLKAMFKPETFKEGRNLSVVEPPTVCLPEDSSKGFRIICRSLYHLNQAEDERTTPPKDLLAAAMLMNKYFIRLSLFQYRPCSNLKPPDALHVAVAGYLMATPLLFSRATARVVQSWESAETVWSNAVKDSETNMSNHVEDDVFTLMDRKKNDLQQRLRVQLRDIIEQHSPRDPCIWSSLEGLMRTKDFGCPSGAPSGSLSSILTNWEREGNLANTTRSNDKNPTRNQNQDPMRSAVRPQPTNQIAQAMPATPATPGTTGLFPLGYPLPPRVRMGAPTAGPPGPSFPPGAPHLPMGGGWPVSPAPPAYQVGSNHMNMRSMGQINQHYHQNLQRQYHNNNNNAQYPAFRPHHHPAFHHNTTQPAPDRVSTRKFLQALYKDAKGYAPKGPPSKKDVGFVMACLEVTREWNDFTGALCVYCARDDAKSLEEALACSGYGCYK
ncbi:MAG: hypothetical protein M1831_002615 [Alyxoria varia]|nr:MAG: hypothetical protein M1831_002615 [Alyxoria varia]